MEDDSLGLVVPASEQASGVASEQASGVEAGVEARVSGAGLVLLVQPPL